LLSLCLGDGSFVILTSKITSSMATFRRKYCYLQV
jgi:hypothetical protein